MRIGFLIAILAAATLAACRMHPGTVTPQPQAAPERLEAPQRVVGAGVRDQALAEKVKRSLVGNDPDPYGIEVVASSGAVQLYGSAYNAHERKRLGVSAAAVVGVRSVENNIVIDPGV